MVEETKELIQASVELDLALGALRSVSASNSTTASDNAKTILLATNHLDSAKQHLRLAGKEDLQEELPIGLPLPKTHHVFRGSRILEKFRGGSACLKVRKVIAELHRATDGESVEPSPCKWHDAEFLARSARHPVFWMAVLAWNFAVFWLIMQR